MISTDANMTQFPNFGTRRFIININHCSVFFFHYQSKTLFLMIAINKKLGSKIIVSCYFPDITVKCRIRYVNIKKFFQQISTWNIILVINFI